MLKTGGFLKDLVKTYKHTSTIPGFGYWWNESSSKFLVVKKRRLAMWIIVLLLQATMNALTLKEYVRQQDTANISFGILVVSGSLTCACIMWFNYMDAEAFTKFLNSLLQVENYFNPISSTGVPQWKEDSFKMAHLLCKTFILSEAATPLLLGVGCLLLPCSFPNLLVPLNPHCELIGQHMEITGVSMEAKNVGIYLIMVPLNVLIWKAIVAAGLVGCMHLMIGIICQRTMLNKILRIVGRRTRFDISLYRQAQLVNILFNKCHGGILFAIMTGACFIQTCAAYILFQRVGIPFAVSLWNLTVFFNLATVTIYVFGLAGSLHHLSVDILGKIRNKKKKGDHVLGKSLKACAPLKITFGLNNFVEKETPLKLFEYSVDRFIDLLLLGN